MKTVLTIICMHCGKEMGKKDGEGKRGKTSGICKECWYKHYPQYGEYPPEEFVVPGKPVGHKRLVDG